ncbi:MAG TPA: Spy/CpxP family protein refolding chaperone [Pyrinomonadaceae bacterium]|jgi:Spy/CpxP family protein refolding chaperone|nr:Spy/CpxP family protein refolding chaperone [Pyrinomonadaceae bacterium]
MKSARRKLFGGALAFAAALTLALAVAGFAQDGPQGPGGFGGPRHGGPGGRGGRGPGGVGLGPVARELNPTDAQKEQIKQIGDAFETSTKSLREQLFARGGGGPLDGLKEFDEAAVRSAAQARAAVQVELEVARARAQSQIYAVLTAEQKAKLAELRQQFEQRRQERGRRGEGRPDGGM